MSNVQVITIDEQGDISGLQRKPGQGIDLREFGKADIHRASEICFDGESQQWYVHVLTGALSGQNVTLRLMAQNLTLDATLSILERFHLPMPLDVYDHLYLFDDYDTATQFEIAVLDAIRVVNPDILICDHKKAPML